MIVEIECLATPPGTEENRYAHVEAAIRVVEESGLKYQVNALGTLIEGEPDELWPLLRKVHETCLAAGAESLVSIIKVAQSGPQRQALSMQGLTAKYRD